MKVKTEMKRTDAKPIPWEGFDYEYPGKVAPACREIVNILSDGNWHRWSEITKVIGNQYELQAKTVCNLLHGMVKTRGIERRGVYQRGVDRREARLATK